MLNDCCFLLPVVSSSLLFGVCCGSFVVRCVLFVVCWLLIVVGC